MKCVIDTHSGFCAGVIKAIKSAENYLAQHHRLYCLGDIVHNNEEVNRLINLGLSVISHKEFANLHNVTVLIRAHGEPPETYKIAQKNNITLIDATCPVVLDLQKKIKAHYERENRKDEQILIFGKKGHAEVVGLLGQTGEQGVVISSVEDLYQIDFQKHSTLYSQTTQNLEAYSLLIAEIKKRYQAVGNEDFFAFHDTICRSVANRSYQIRKFASQYDKIIFVSGEKSSNGLYMFSLCKEMNPNSFFISKTKELEHLTFRANESVGICGATSTPMWLMEEVKVEIFNLQKAEGDFRS